MEIPGCAYLTLTRIYSFSEIFCRWSTCIRELVLSCSTFSLVVSAKKGQCIREGWSWFSLSQGNCAEPCRWLRATGYSKCKWGVEPIWPMYWHLCHGYICPRPESWFIVNADKRPFYRSCMKALEGKQSCTDSTDINGIGDHLNVNIYLNQII